VAEDATGVAKPGKEAFDCQDGLDNFEVLWSEEKKHWCCQHKEAGCLPPFDCNDAPDGWAWPAMKKEWCCEHEKRGCPMETRTAETLATASHGVSGSLDSITPPLDTRASARASGPGIYLVAIMSLGTPAAVYLMYCRNRKDTQWYPNAASVGTATQFGRSYTQMRSYNNTGTYVPPAFG